MRALFLPAMLSLVPYRALLADGELRAAFGTSLLGRAPIGIAGLGLLLLVQSVRDSYVASGAVTAAYVMGLGCVAPLWGRLIDRTGPRPVLRACALLYPVTILLLLGAVFAPVPGWVAALASAAAGATLPPVTMCMRSLLRQRVSDETKLATAFALDAILIELVFIGGPLLVALLVALWAPWSAMAAAAFCGCAGAWLFQRTAALRAWRVPQSAGRGLLGPLAARRFIVLLAVVLGYSAAFGLIEIGVAAYAQSAARPALAGIMLGVMSVGSVLGGLAYGSRRWHQPLALQFAASLAGMGLGVVPLAIYGAPAPFALFSAFAGLTMAPPLIIQAMLVTKTVRPEHATEGFTWTASALLSGVGIGLAAGGMLAERISPPAVFFAAAVTSLLAALAAFTVLGRDA
jgi:MFS family permease